MKRAHLLSAVISFIVLGPLAAIGSPEDHVSDALAASQDWVAQIDRGDYDESYAVAADAMKDKVPLDRWDLILKSLRAHWGAVLSRKEISHVYKPDGMQGASGQFMVITYDTSFAQLQPATETIVLHWEGGKWRGAGYNAGAKATESNPDPDEGNSATEINTQEHVRPQANTPATAQ